MEGFKFVVVALASTFASVVHAAEFPNGSYGPSEVFTPIVVLDDSVMISDVPGSSAQPRGSNAVMVLDGYFIIMGSSDSGSAGGVLHVMDVSDPTDPVLVSYAADPLLRELHSMPAVSVDDGFITVLPTIEGIQVWDLTSPESGPALLGSVALDGVDGGDYDNTAWQLSVAWPYAFVGATGAGVHVVDISDPSSPQPVNQITTGEMGIGKAGPIYVAGNTIVVTTMDTFPTRVAVIDVADPTIPIPLGTGEAPALARTYSTLVIGDRIYGPGDLGTFYIATWAATDVSADVEFITQTSFGGDKGGYCSFQDDFVFCGQSGNGFYKIDVGDEDNPVSAGNGGFDVGEPDMDFATVLGNLVFVSNDHTGGPQGAFIPHQPNPDLAPPAVMEAFPVPDSTNIPLSTRFTVFFSDDIDLATVDGGNFLVRRVSDGSTVAGVFSRSSLNAITFSPREDLDVDETYDITLVGNGLTDVAGNAFPENIEVGRFATGAEIDDSPLDPPDPTGGDDSSGGDMDGDGDGGDDGGDDDEGTTTGEAPEKPDPPTGMGGTGSDGEGGASSGGGGGCRTGGAAPPPWLLLLLLAGVRRRR